MLKPYATIGAQTITRFQAKTRLWKGLIYRHDLMREPCLWSHFLTPCAMVLGILVIMISHEGYEPPDAAANALPPVD